jgi:hypothetical protein
MENRFQEFSYDERLILGRLLDGADIGNESVDSIKQLKSELDLLSNKDKVEKYDWEVIGWNDEQENIIIPISHKNASRFLNILNVKLNRYK